MHSWSKKATLPNDAMAERPGKRRRSRAAAAKRRVRLQARYPPSWPSPHSPDPETAPGPNFSGRRLVKSGGTVEQYKQPHLVPDLHIAESFRSLEPVS